MAFFLDTNVWIDALKGRRPGIAQRLRSLSPALVKVPAIVAAELLLGANRLPEAVAFLSPLDTAKEKLDWRSLEQHALDLAARGVREKDSKLLLQAWGFEPVNRRSDQRR